MNNKQLWEKCVNNEVNTLKDDILYINEKIEIKDKGIVKYIKYNKDTDTYSLHFDDANLMDIFYSILDDRLELCHKALLTRHESVKNIKAINSAMLWQYGVYGRLSDNETVGDLMKQHPLSASISLGYVGLYEVCRALLGESNTTDAGQQLSKEVLQFMNNKCLQWKAQGDFVPEADDEKLTVIKDNEEFELDE